MARCRSWWAVAVVLAVAVVGSVVAQPQPALAAQELEVGVAAARDAEGRLVTVTVTGTVTSPGFSVSRAEAWRQACPGCGWVPVGVVAWFPRGIPSLSLAADGRLELISWSSYGGEPPVLRVVRESCPGCGFVTGDPLDIAWGEVLDAPPPPTPSITDLGVAVGSNPDGRRELFTSAADGNVWHSWEWCPGCGWSEWEPLGPTTGDPVVGAPAVSENADGRLEVFVRRASGALSHAWQWCSGGCGWSRWSGADGQTGTAMTSPGLARNADGRLEVFAGIAGILHHSWQECAGCGWTTWVPIDGAPPVFGPVPAGRAVSGVAAASNADGRLEVFFDREGSPPEHVWQLCAGCWWGPTLPLSG